MADTKDDYIGPDRWASNKKKLGQQYPTTPRDQVAKQIRDRVRVRLNPNLPESNNQDGKY